MGREKNIAVEAALGAGRMIKSCVGKVKSIRYKGAINIVTDVDERAEAMIIRALKKSFPDYGVLAEESPAEEKGNYRWIIDPLDGTTNFAHGFPFFAVSIALEKDGGIVLGVVYDPVHDELFTAEQGKGAYRNKKRIFVSGENGIGKALLATGFAYNFKEKKEKNIDYFGRFLKASMAVRRAGAATIDLCYVASGRAAGFWEFKLSPWDFCAGALIVKEAGGRVTGKNGEGVPFDQKYFIVSSNGKIHKQMLEVINRHPIKRKDKDA
jgi:myo-inositol-1(or 4)-monophosphatase